MTADPGAMVSAGTQLDECALSMEVAANTLGGLGTELSPPKMGASLAGDLATFEAEWQLALTTLAADLRARGDLVSATAVAVEFVDAEVSSTFVLDGVH